MFLKLLFYFFEVANERCCKKERGPFNEPQKSKIERLSQPKNGMLKIIRVEYVSKSKKRLGLVSEYMHYRLSQESDYEKERSIGFMKELTS